MKLTELDAKLYRWDRESGEKTAYMVQTLPEADYVFFLCPKCYRVNGGEKGTHSVMVPFAGRANAPEWAGIRDRNGNKVFWDVSGTGLEDLTTKPSILLLHGCQWHGYITNGDAA